MAEYLSPGVYVEEYDSAPRSIEGVGTSTAGFIGLAERGPAVGAPLLVTNFSSFTKQFGGFLSEFEYGEYRFLANSVEQYFANGGTRCYVSRVVPDDAKKAEKTAGILKLEAANEGKWGNRIQVKFTNVKKKKMQLRSEVAGQENTYEAKSVSGFREGDYVTIGDEYNQITTIYDNNVTFAKPFTANVVDDALVPETVLYLVETDISVRYNDEFEVYAGVSFNIKSPSYIATKLAGSSLVRVEVSPMTDIVNPVSAILGSDESKDGITLENGSDGSIDNVNAGTFIGVDGGPGNRTGILSFVENNIVSMLAVPGITLPEVVVSLVAHCEKLGSRFAVIDMPKDMKKTDELINYRNMIDSTYAAMYHPWIEVFDRSANKSGYIPPSGAVCGVYARTDVNRGVHKAPANETLFCTGLKTNYTKEEQDILNPEGINLIRQLPGQGIKVWGARTASSNSAFKYVNVRRLFIFVEESIKANTNWVVFEPNDATLWSRVNVTISSFLENLWRNGMLAGSTPQEGYFVEIGPSTMTDDDIKNGRLICNIGIAATRPAEFVIFRVTQHTASGGSAE
jgi:hypothetical protein